MWIKKGTITRARFEELNEKLFQSTLEPVVEALKLAKLNKKDIDQVVLVGGSSWRFGCPSSWRAPKEVPSIQVTFSVDCNNILHCSAVDLATGKSKKVTITSNGKLTKQQIEDVIEEGWRNKEEDLWEAKRLEALYELEEYCFNIAQTLKSTPDIAHWSDVEDDDDDGDGDDSDEESSRFVSKNDIMQQCEVVTDWLQCNALAELEEFSYQMSLMAKMFNPFIKRLYRLKRVEYSF